MRHGAINVVIWDRIMRHLKIDMSHWGSPIKNPTGPGADPGGGGVPFGGPPNFIKKEKMAHACARKLRILVLNSYPDPPPFRNPVSAPAGITRLPSSLARDLSCAIYKALHHAFDFAIGSTG